MTTKTTRAQPAIRVALLALTLTAVSACDPRVNDDPPRAPRAATWTTADRLIADSGLESESRLHLAENSREVDFASPEALEGVRLVNLSHQQTADGLEGSPTTPDPQVIFEQELFPFQVVDFEIRSPTGGVFELFWAGPEENFAAERRQQIAVGASPEFRTYSVDLRSAAPPAAGGYRFRLDPAREGAFTLRRMAFREPYEVVAQTSGTGKVRLGRETRLVRAIRAGEPVEWPIPRVPDDAKLVFGLAPASADRRELRFSVSFRDPAGQTHRLFERRFGGSAPRAWSDHEISLGALAWREGTLVAEVERATESGFDGDTDVEAGAVLWAHPHLVARGEPSPQPNVILVSIDTLGARHLSAQGAKGVRDPFLSRLADEGTLFENASAHSSVTDVSHAAMLTGRLPFNGNLFWLERGRLGEPTLADLLRARGYATAGFTAGVLVSETLGFDRGFEVFYQHDSLFQPTLKTSDILPVLDRARSWVERNAAGPFFLFLHTYEVHSPYLLHDRLEAPGRLPSAAGFTTWHMRGRLPPAPDELGQYVVVVEKDGTPRRLTGQPIGEAEIGQLVATYRGEIAGVDQHLGNFFAELEARGLLENSIVVVTSDHGEAFFEHGLPEHGLLWEENLHVPLILWGPGRVPARLRVETPVRSVDIVPTVLALAGAAPLADLDGRSLIPLLQKQPLDSSGSYSFVAGNGFAWRSGHDKLLRTSAIGAEAFGTEEAFDLRRDPDERRSLAPQDAGPRAIEELSRTVVRGIPGAFVSLDAFAGRDVELQIDADETHLGHLHGFGLTPVPGDGRADPASRRRMHVGADPLLVRLGEPRAGTLHIAVRAPGDAEEQVFAVDFSTLREEPTRISSPTGGTLTAWRVASRSGVVGDSTLSAEEREKLRALGYVE